MARRILGYALAAAVLAKGVLAEDILQTVGFTNCNPDSNITVEKVDITYNNNNKTVTFDVLGSSTKEQKVIAVLNVTAYGQNVYSNTFNPCDNSTFVEQLCPGIYTPITSVTMIYINIFDSPSWNLWSSGHSADSRRVC